MKNLLTATLPALALLALGGCASTGALTTSTETDGVYYSSKDHTTAVGSPAGVYSGNGTSEASGTIPARSLDDTTPASVATTEDANPDYQGGTTTQAATGSDYYNDSYSAYNGGGFGQPYTGPGVSSFNYSPSATYAVSPSYYGSPYGYASAFGYGYSPFSYGLGGFGSPYGSFYDPYYSSFYSPFGYGFGSGLSIGFGYGFGGFGGFGYPYGLGYSPFGYGGYGYGYGRGGYYDSYYGGGYSRPVIYANGTRTGSGANPILVGPRGGRGGSVMNNAAAADPNAINNMNGRRATSTYSTGGVAAPTPTYNSANGQPAYNQSASKAGRAATNFGGGQVVGQPTYSTPGATAGQNNNAVPQAQAAGRRGFFSGFFGNGTGASPGTTTAGGDQGAQRRSYNQSQYNNAGTQQRSYSQPTYNQPQQRTYSQPTYTQPQPARSFGGGNFGGGGGGSFGGGGGGGGGRRGGR
jgi:hypothetical protein